MELHGVEFPFLWAAVTLGPCSAGPERVAATPANKTATALDHPQTETTMEGEETLSLVS